ncbi:MAG: hypothetical protein H3C48_04490 [Chitinophagaceae bacterium]|nr:hypothetical protein [Chitinophagaceae bacterium]
MADLNDQINRVNEKLQLLLYNYNKLQKENVMLSRNLERTLEREKELNERITGLQQQLEIAKLSSSETGGEMAVSMEKRINGYIKEIDECIALLMNR